MIYFAFIVLISARHYLAALLFPPFLYTPILFLNYFYGGIF